MADKRSWSSEDIESLCRMYPNKPDHVLASQLNRSVSGIQRKATELGLQKSQQFQLYYVVLPFFGTIAFAIALCGGGCWMINGMREQAEERRKEQAFHDAKWQSFIGEKLAAARENDKASEAAVRPYRRGLIHVNEAGIRKELAEDLQATDPSDCETLCLVSKRKIRVSKKKYSNGAKAYRWKYHVRLVDCTSNLEIANLDFDGSYPPEKIYHRKKEGVGEPPDKRIAAWLSNLPLGPPVSPPSKQ